jgi:hypothetical protein
MKFKPQPKVQIKQGRTRYIPAPLFHRRIVIVTNPWHIALIGVAIVIGMSISFARVLDIVSVACVLGSLFFVVYSRNQVAKLRDEVKHVVSGTLINMDGDIIDVTDIGADEGGFTDDAPSTFIRVPKHNEKA